MAEVGLTSSMKGWGHSALFVVSWGILNVTVVWSMLTQIRLWNVLTEYG